MALDGGAGAEALNHQPCVLCVCVLSVRAVCSAPKNRVTLLQRSLRVSYEVVATQPKLMRPLLMDIARTVRPQTLNIRRTGAHGYDYICTKLVRPTMITSTTLKLDQLLVDNGWTPHQELVVVKNVLCSRSSALLFIVHIGATIGNSSSAASCRRQTQSENLSPTQPRYTQCSNIKLPLRQ